MKAQAAKEPTAKGYLSKFPIAPRCSRCTEIEPNCSKQAVACLCWKCTAILAELWKYRVLKRTPARVCPGCGGPIEVRKRFCKACRKRRRSSTYRAARGRQQ